MVRHMGLVAAALVAVMLAVSFAAPLVHRADARSRPVIDLRQMAVKARGDARRACKAREIVIEFGVKLRSCESWLATPCFRQSLSRPDVGYCYGSILLDDKRTGGMICNKVLRYRASARGSIRPLVTLPWGCFPAGSAARR